MSEGQKSLNIPILARVEGEGAMDLVLEKGQIKQLDLRIYEPPRFFEGFLCGRDPDEVIDAQARICGICPVTYQMTASQAFEQCFGVTPSPWVQAMRRAMYCGEWIESHYLHMHFLAAPDFLRYRSAIELAKDHPEVVKRGVKLQRVGNDIVSLFGKRSVHPVGACVGGFYSAPAPEAVAALVQKIDNALPEAAEAVRWFAGLTLPDEQQAFTCVSLKNTREYPFLAGNIASTKGHWLDKQEFQAHFAEHHAPHSTALHSLLDGEPYLVGPLARINLNYEVLPLPAQQLIEDIGWRLPSYNMFHSVLARGVECYAALLEARAILAQYAYPDQARVPVALQAGEGFGCTEAPRGMQWQHILTDETGKVKHINIVPPTSQNQAQIEANLRQSLTRFGLEQEDEALRYHAEMVIRNYDPCISCSVHFLKANIARHG